MPTLSGYDLAKLIRSKKDGELKLMFVSVVPERTARLSDADGFIQKPFSEKTFMEKVMQVMEKKGR